MRNKALFITVLSAAALACGCEENNTASEQLEKAKTETKEAARDLKDYTYAQKQEFVQAMQTNLKALNQDLEKLSAKINSSSDAVKADVKPKLQALREQANQLGKQLDDIKNANRSTWDKVKTGAEKAFGALTNGIDQARQWVSQKVAP